MPLDRKAVMEYADKHWFTPCDDGLIYSYMAKGSAIHVEQEKQRLEREGKLSGSGWKAVLLPEVDANNHVVDGKERGCFIRPNPDGEEIIAGKKPAALTGKFDIVAFYERTGEHDGLVDCAHYVSRCLTAGGVKINHPGVPGLVSELRDRRPDTRTLGLEITRAQGDRIMNTGVMKPGDLIAYVHEDPKTHSRGYAHSALYTGIDAHNVHRLTCHTTARFKEFFFHTPWNITVDPEWRFTLIHFSDDVFPPLPQPSRFQVTQGATAEVWDFKPNGHIVRGHGSSSPHQVFGARPGDRGYWVIHGLNLFVFWPRTGQVASMGFVSLDDTDTFPVTIDGQPATMQAVS